MPAEFFLVQFVRGRFLRLAAYGKTEKYELNKYIRSISFHFDPMKSTFSLRILARSLEIRSNQNG